jgi:hypothetical protein
MCRLVGKALPNAHLLEAGTMMAIFATISQNGTPELFRLDLAFPGSNPLETLADVLQSCPKSMTFNVTMLDDQTTIEKIKGLT